MSASSAPTPYIQRQPFSNEGPASANGRPSGQCSDGVVSSSPPQMPKNAPSADMVKMTAV